MALRSNGPVMLALPPFRGVTRRIILIAASSYLVLALLGWLLPGLVETLVYLTALMPDFAALHHEVWQFLTYPFVSFWLLSTLFALLSVWFFGSTLEDDRGRRWMSEYYFVTTAGGGVLASLLYVVLNGRGGWLPYGSVMTGLWGFSMALVVAFAAFQPDAPVRFYFVLELKAKYLAAIYLLVYLAISLRGGDRFGAVVVLLSSGCGYAYLRLVSRRGLRYELSEWWFGLRNSYYRARRRRAGKKFTVYMKKQGRDVSLDAEGRYVDPNGKARDLEKNWDDKKWMN